MTSSSSRGGESRSRSRVRKLSSIIDNPSDDEDDTFRGEQTYYNFSISLQKDSLDLEAQPSLDPEDNDKGHNEEDNDDDESFPLLNESGAPDTLHNSSASNLNMRRQSLRRQYRYFKC